MSTDYSNSPIIVEGVNHSGTRLLVDVLSVFGSDGGDYSNPWNEHVFFLELHNALIDRISDRGWTETILNLDFITQYVDDGSHAEFIQSRLSAELDDYFPERSEKPWHWKCPTSALFEKTWVDIFPDAWYVINRREPAKIAKAFVRRKGIASMSFEDGLRFYHCMESKIMEIPKNKQLVVDFDNLSEELKRIADFVPLDVSGAQIDKARGLINYHPPRWNAKRPVFYNIKGMWADLVYRLYRNGVLKTDLTLSND